MQIRQFHQLKQDNFELDPFPFGKPRPPLFNQSSFIQFGSRKPLFLETRNPRDLYSGISRSQLCMKPPSARWVSGIGVASGEASCPGEFPPAPTGGFLWVFPCPHEPSKKDKGSQTNVFTDLSLPMASLVFSFFFFRNLRLLTRGPPWCELQDNTCFPKQWKSRTAVVQGNDMESWGTLKPS